MQPQDPFASSEVETYIAMCVDIARSGRVFRGQHVGPLRPTRVAQALQIGGKLLARVVRAALAQDGLHRVDRVRGRALHVIEPSVQLGQRVAHDLRVLRCDVALLVRVGLDVDEHHVGKRVVPVVVRLDDQPPIEPHRALAAPRALREDEVIPPRSK